MLSRGIGFNRRSPGGLLVGLGNPRAQGSIIIIYNRGRDRAVSKVVILLGKYGCTSLDIV